MRSGYVRVLQSPFDVDRVRDGDVLVIPVVDPGLAARLARIIHERFCCNRSFAAATSLHAASAACRRAGSPLSRSLYCREYASLPRGSTRPSRNATGRFLNEPS